MIVQKGTLDFTIGSAREVVFTFLSTAKKSILSSTDASPAVLHVPEHGYATGDIVKVADHVNVFGDESSINGTHIITVIDDDHFSVPIDNNGKGTRSGYVAKPLDLTSYTASAQIRVDDSDGATLVHTYTGELRTAPYTHGKVTLTLTDEQTSVAAFKARRGMTVAEGVVLTLAGNAIERITNIADVHGRAVQ